MYFDLDSSSNMNLAPFLQSASVMFAMVDSEVVEEMEVIDMTPP